MAQADIWDGMDGREPMEPDEFWGWIESARAVSRVEGLAHERALGQLLSMRPLGEVASYKKRFGLFSRAANSDAMHAFLGGSDDGFHYNISGLISLGRAVYEAALADPGSIPGEVPSFELFEYAPDYAYEEPSRSKLRALALPRMERSILEGSVPAPGLSKPGPRV